MKAHSAPNYLDMAIRALLGILLVSTTFVPTAPALGAQSVLGRRNTITAKTDGTLDVILPRDVTLPLKTSVRSPSGPAPWITFEGGGRATGLVLVPKGTASPIVEGLVAVQFRSCRGGCRERPVNALMINSASYHDEQRLHAGEYSLYVFTDGQPATIQLDLEQLSGSSTIQVGRRAHADIRTPATHVDHRDDATVFSAGASYEMKGHDGLFMSVNVMRDARYQDASFDECLSADRDVPDELEATMCLGGFRFIQPLDPTRIQPRKGGFIVTSFFGLHDSTDNVFNGDSSLQHYNFRIVSPGSIRELWSQGMILSF